jgi:hypothetical protein
MISVVRVMPPALSVITASAIISVRIFPINAHRYAGAGGSIRLDYTTAPRQQTHQTK